MIIVLKNEHRKINNSHIAYQLFNQKVAAFMHLNHCMYWGKIVKYGLPACVSRSLEWRTTLTTRLPSCWTVQPWSQFTLQREGLWRWVQLHKYSILFDIDSEIWSSTEWQFIFDLLKVQQQEGIHTVYILTVFARLPKSKSGMKTFWVLNFPLRFCMKAN